VPIDFRIYHYTGLLKRKNINRWSITLVAILLTHFILNAQDSTHTIAKVTIPGTKSDVQRFLSPVVQNLNQLNNYADLLRVQSGVFIRSQGPGVLHTPSFKGLSATNLPVVINGFGMQSAMNGTLDLSLLNGIHFGNARFANTYDNTTQRSNIGDALELSNSASKEQQFLAQFSSLYNLSLGARISQQSKSKQVKNELSFAGSSKQNRFSTTHYGDALVSSSPDEITAAGKSLSVMNSLNASFEKVNWTSTFFLVQANRNIPPSLFAPNDGLQEDLNTFLGNRLSWGGNWKHRISNQLWLEEINYQSNKASIDALSTCYSVNTVYTANYQSKNKLDVQLGLANENSFYISNQLAENVNWMMLRGFYSFTKKWRNQTLQWTNQHQWFKSKWYTSAGLFYTHRVRRWVFKTSLQKIYRLPTLNELYWDQPGASGNENLLAETGYAFNGEAATNVKAFTFSVNPFVGWYNNLIAWQYLNQTLKPINQRRLFNYGFIGKGIYRKKLSLGVIEVTQNIHVVRSVYNDRYESSTLGMQQIFTPLITSNNVISIQRNRFQAYVGQQLIGTNYTTRDNTSFIEPYWLLDVGIGYTVRKWTASLVGQNLFNHAYFTIPSQAMPGRNININIQFNL
jgi:vitamin B12 transporter